MTLLNKHITAFFPRSFTLEVWGCLVRTGRKSFLMAFFALPGKVVAVKRFPFEAIQEARCMRYSVARLLFGLPAWFFVFSFLPALCTPISGMINLVRSCQPGTHHIGLSYRLLVCKVPVRS